MWNGSKTSLLSNEVFPAILNKKFFKLKNINMPIQVMADDFEQKPQKLNILCTDYNSDS